MLALGAVAAFASPPDSPFYIDLAHPTVQFERTYFAGNTPDILVGILTNGLPYNGFSSYTPELNYCANNKASALKTISGTISGNIASFQALTNSFPASGDFFCEVYFSTAYGASKITAGQGILHIQPSPSSGSYGSLNLMNRVNWDVTVSVGTPPWVALTEPVFLASVAYQITWVMTNNWTTSYLDELLLRTQFNSTSGQVNNALGVLTTNLAREISRATNAEVVISNAYVAAIAVETSRATNVETIISNSIATAVAVETTRATNAEAVLQGEITAMTLSSNTIFRSVALSNGNTRVESLASGLGVTAALVGTEITMTIPAGVHVFSLMIKWDTPNNGSSFTLDMGVTDMTNDDVADRWNALFQAYTDDNGQLIAGANCKMDTANLSKLIIQGLQTRCINHCRFGF